MKDNYVWFSTSIGRIFRLDIKDEIIADQTDNCGLEGYNILKLLAVDDRLWIISDKTIICHNQKQKRNTFYSVNDDNIFVTPFRHSAAFIHDKDNL